MPTRNRRRGLPTEPDANVSHAVITQSDDKIIIEEEIEIEVDLENQ